MVLRDLVDTTGHLEQEDTPGLGSPFLAQLVRTRGVYFLLLTHVSPHADLHPRAPLDPGVSTAC